MSSKVTFRARMVDSARPLSIFKAEELPDIADINNMGRSVPALPSGMEKEEEGEKHLQDILAVGLVDTGMVIPTPECSEITKPAPAATQSSQTSDSDPGTVGSNQYEKMYLSEYKQPRQYIHVQPFASNQDIPDYDMDEEDAKFFEEELRSRRKMDVTQFTFEDMIDKLEKNSTVNAVTIKEAKLILKEDDDLILLVYDYWLNKRLSLATQQSLVPRIKTVNHSQTHNPYVCFRRRTEKMMTRRNRKNEEASYESMLKLRRDLSRAVTLLDMVRRREKTKKEKLNLTLDIFNKRHNSQDWDGKLMETVMASLTRQRLQSTNLNIHSWMSLSSPSPPRKSYKLKRRRGPGGRGSPRLLDSPSDRMISSEDETGLYAGSDDDMEESKSPFVFTRREGVQYHAPLDDLTASNTQNREASEAFVLTGMRLGQSLRCLGHCRRRVGRGGRVVIDRLGGKYDESEEMMARAVTPPGLEDDMDWDPYMTRQQEEQVSTAHLNNNKKGFKIVDMNRAGAHNAAGALVPSQFVG